MKFSFVAIAAMATSAFAAPASITTPLTSTGDLTQSVNQLTQLAFGGLGVSQIVDGATGTATGLAKRADPITDAQGLISMLTSGLANVKQATGALNQTVSQVQSGDLSQVDATKQAAAQLQDMHFKLADILKQILGAAGLDVSATDLDTVLSLVVALVAEVLFTVKALLTILGIRPQLASILHSVFGLLSNILAALVSLLAGLLPGLVAALTPLLVSLGNGILAPLLTVVAGLLAGLAGVPLAL